MATVLIVDDDSFIRKALQTIVTQDPVLKGFDLQVLTADNGEAALKLYRQARPQFVITDLLMPKMDGFAVCEAIRAEPGGEAAHIAIVSGVYRDPAIIQRVQSEFRAKFFTKPYQLKDLAQLIARTLQSKHPRAPTPAPVPMPSHEPRSGDLSERPLAAVLLDLLDEEATGVLRLSRGKVVKHAHLFVGHPLAVESNMRSETLGAYLKARGFLTDVQLDQALGRATRHGIRVGESLIDMGVLTPEELLERLVEQSKFKLVNALRWPDGTWKFTPSDVPETSAKSDPIDVSDLVVDGLA